MELIIFIGLQASGKSSFYRTRFEKTHEHISKDLLVNNKNRNRRQEQLIAAALRAENPVVVDNTNPTIEERQRLVALGREYGAKIIGYYFQSHIRVCLERNRQRTRKARVPDVALYATANRLAPPSYSEGFDKLYSVHISDDFAFEVLSYTD